MNNSRREFLQAAAGSSLAGDTLGVKAERGILDVRRASLEPGDLIFTGTPPGVILGMPKEKQVWLKAGDQIACSVGNLGELRFSLA